jgi:hypothetical protein
MFGQPSGHLIIRDLKSEATIKDIDLDRIPLAHRRDQATELGLRDSFEHAAGSHTMPFLIT